MQDSGTAILNAAANVRVLLTEAAAWRLASSADQIEHATTAWRPAPDGRQRRLRRAGRAAARCTSRPSPTCRAATGRRRCIGEDLPRVDIPAKVTGGAAYVQDMRLPGMLHARVVRGPSDGTRLKDADIAAVAGCPAS